jgi:hypothetical protein
LCAQDPGRQWTTVPLPRASLVPADGAMRGATLHRIVAERIVQIMDSGPLTGDGRYGAAETIVAIAAQQIDPYVPLAEVGQRAGVFGEQDVRYDPVADIYRCPGTTGAALPLPERGDPPADLSGTGGRVQRVSAPGALHPFAAGTAHRAQPRRGVLGWSGSTARRC